MGILRTGWTGSAWRQSRCEADALNGKAAALEPDLKQLARGQPPRRRIVLQSYGVTIGI